MDKYKNNNIVYYLIELTKENKLDWKTYSTGDDSYSKFCNLDGIKIVIHKEKTFLRYKYDITINYSNTSINRKHRYIKKIFDILEKKEDDEYNKNKIDCIDKCLETLKIANSDVENITNEEDDTNDG